jgi:rhamnosyltransferase
MSQFKASVVIPTKNAGLLFERVLDSVLSQETPWPFEVLVVDSGSSDGTVEHCLNNGVRLHQIPSAEFGHGKTRNLGVSLTSGEFVVMITHDALPCDANWLHELVKAIEVDEDIAGVFGRHYAYEESGILMQRDLLGHFDGFKIGSPIVSNEDSQRYESDQGYRQFLHFFSDNNACLRRSVWEEIPYPEVDFAEDQLWAKTIIERGYKKAYADKAAVFHSHSYGVIQTFRRSYDESRALKALFGYELCSSLKNMFRHAYHITKADWKYVFDQHKVRATWPLILKIPLLSFAKQAGYYLGYRDSGQGRIHAMVSLDKSLNRQ